MYGRIHEDVSTRLTPPSRKRTVSRGALYTIPYDVFIHQHFCNHAPPLTNGEDAKGEQEMGNRLHLHVAYISVFVNLPALNGIIVVVGIGTADFD